MSWVYWGIVFGLVAMVVTLIVSMAIYYGTPNESEGEATGHPSSEGENARSATKHAA
jgi:hypothetical protein